MVTRTINFESEVLERLQKLANENGTTISKMVNKICEDSIVEGKIEEYYSQQAEKYGWLAEQTKQEGR
jgi:predicted DNA-binding protein